MTESQEQCQEIGSSGDTLVDTDKFPRAQLFKGTHPFTDWPEGPEDELINWLLAIDSKVLQWRNFRAEGVSIVDGQVAGLRDTKVILLKPSDITIDAADPTLRRTSFIIPVDTKGTWMHVVYLLARSHYLSGLCIANGKTIQTGCKMTKRDDPHNLAWFSFPVSDNHDLSLSRIELLLHFRGKLWTIHFSGYRQKDHQKLVVKTKPAP